MPRLNQVTKELNIGYHTAADFLRRRFGAVVGPNDKITEEQYAALAEEFHGDKVLHSAAMKRVLPRQQNRRSSMRVQNKELTKEEAALIEADRVKPKNYHDLGLDSAVALKIKKSGESLHYPNMSKNARIISIPFGGRNKKR